MGRKVEIFCQEYEVERRKAETVCWKRKKATKREQVSSHVMKVNFEVVLICHSFLVNNDASLSIYTSRFYFKC